MKKNYYGMMAGLAFILMSFSIQTNAQNRSISGENNNPVQADWGAVGTDQLMVTPVGYSDGISEPAGLNRMNPREISNLIFHQDELLPDALELSDYAWVWGQFIDHDITLSEEDHTVPNNISVPSGDEYFDPNGTGTVIIGSFRSAYNPTTGTDVNNPRRFPNSITAFVDASNVYGSDKERSDWLRTFINGQLKTSEGNMLPYNTVTGAWSADVDPDAPGMAMANPFLTKWFVAGDVRANENILLSSMHTIFLREHNRLCNEIMNANPSFTDEMIYQRARKILGALIQAIVYEEWLPVLGVDLGAYNGYDETVNPGIMNIFSSAAYRYGHTVINSNIFRLEADGTTIPEGNINLKDAFFNPPVLISGGGVDPLIRGMATQVEQDFDTKMVSDLRNFLFGPPGAGGLDLAALNINRGRERGLIDYNSVRSHFGLDAVNNFNEITGNSDLAQLLETAYGNVNDLDPWVGFLAEDHMSSTLFGESVMKIMEIQFRNLRDGDRFFYLNDPELQDEYEIIKNTRLSDIIMRNSNVDNLQNNVFLATPMTVAVSDVKGENAEMTVYPNPSSGNYFVGLNNQLNEMGLFRVYDMRGKVVFEKEEQLNYGINKFEISLDTYPSGFYTLLIQTKTGVRKERLIKI